MRTIGVVVALMVTLGCAGAMAAEVVELQRGVTRLSEIGVYRMGFQRHGQPVTMMPEGWVGHFEAASGVSYTPWVRQNGKETILLHSPWRGGTGISFVEYNLALPQVTPITFNFAIAMQERLTDESDGSHFRATVTAGSDTLVVCDEDRKSTEWKEFDADLSRFAGKSVILRLEIGPGPKDDPSFDYSLWGDPEITVGNALSDDERVQAALKIRERWRPAVAKTDLLRLANRSDVGCRPTCDDEFTNTLRREGSAYVFAYHGRDVEMHYELPADCDVNKLAARVADLPLFAAVRGFGFGEALAWKLESARLAGQSLEVRGRYEGGTAKIPASLSLRIAGKTLIIETTAATGPDSFTLGSLGPVPLRRVVSMPYLFAGDVRYLPHNGLYYSAILDWVQTNASSQGGTTAHYGELTTGARNPIHEIGYITVSPDLREVLPNIPLAPSPYLKDLAPRVMIDVWSGTFAENAQLMRDLADYGVTNDAIITHVWQRGGYDNEYPNVLPANAGLGGDEKLREFAQAAEEAGHRFSLHENYVDFYPNSELYIEQDVSRNSQGKLELGWYNGATKVQSYALKPAAYVKYARQFSPDIHKLFGTNAAYLDVHTCVPPWFHVDFDANEPGAGEARKAYDGNLAVFKLEREAHSGPLFGEGNAHMFWSGAVDGVEAQISGGEDAPLLLDFDLLKIHPQQVNHGMGYHERWLREGYAANWGGRVPAQYRMDKYRSMEIAYGHAGFIANQVMRQPTYAVKEHHLVAPVQARYGAAKAVAIEYEVSGRMVDVSDAVAVGALDRVHVKYDPGVEVWVNRREQEWHVGHRVKPYVLPQDCFLAEGAGVFAYSGHPFSFRDAEPSQFCDYAETPTTIFADARSVILRPWKDITPRVASFESLGNRRFRVTYEWRVNETLRADYHAFVHFTNSGPTEGIIFQQDHEPPIPASKWQAGQVVTDGPYEITVPESAGDHFAWTIGLWTPGERVWLRGPQDSTGRIVLGQLKVAADASVTFAPSAGDDTTREAAEQERNMNPQKKMVDFGTVATDGAVFMRREGDTLWIVPVPWETPIEIVLRKGGTRNSWPPGVDLGRQVEVVAEGANKQELKKWVAEVAGDGATLSLRLDVPGARGYMLRKASAQ